MSLLTPARLAQLAQWPALTHKWHFLSATILSVCNRPEEIPSLYTFAMEHVDASERGAVTAQFREALFKAAALIGLPRTINSLSSLRDVTPPELRATKVLRSDDTDFTAKGNELFGRVYGKISGRIHHQLRSAYPDLDWFVIKHEYGPLLAFDKVLGAKDTSLVIVASLVPQDVNPQLKGHLRGALNNGATKEEIDSTCDLAVTIGQWAGKTWRGEVAKLGAKL